MDPVAGLLLSLGIWLILTEVVLPHLPASTWCGTSSDSAANLEKSDSSTVDC
jgi:hypothetical protein